MKRRFWCEVVVSEPYKNKEGIQIFNTGVTLWHTYRTGTATDEEVLADRPTGWGEFDKTIAEMKLHVVRHELTPETAITAERLIAMSKTEAHEWDFESILGAFFNEMAGTRQIGTYDDLLFEEDNPLEVSRRFMEHVGGYFVEVHSLEWHGAPFAVMVRIHDDRKYSSEELVLLDKGLAIRAVHAIHQAWFRGQERQLLQDLLEKNLQQVAADVPLVHFDHHHYELVDGKIVAVVRSRRSGSTP